jgi:hypothetical protein
VYRLVVGQFARGASLDSSRGLQSTDSRSNGRVAERRLKPFNHAHQSIVAPRRKLFPFVSRGLKATATVTGSLRDQVDIAFKLTHYLSSS